MEYTKMGCKGRVTIPKHLQKMFKGKDILIIKIKDGFVLHPLPE